AVDGVRPVGVQVGREACGAADPRDADDGLPAQPELGQEALDRGEDRVVTAPGAPAHLLVGGEVLAGLLLALRQCGDAGDAADRGGDAQIDAHAMTSVRVEEMTSSRSPTLKGRPRTEVWDVTSTRYFARSSMASWPRFISGTMTFSYRARTSPVFSGKGLRWRRWACATDFPAARSRRTAARLGP